MGLGLILLGLGFVVMYQADKLATQDGKVGPQWLGFVYLLFTMGELCLSPIGLSLVNKLAPVKLASLMMASGSSARPSPTTSREHARRDPRITRSTSGCS